MDRTGRTSADILHQLEREADARGPTPAAARRRHLAGENLRMAALAGLFTLAVAWEVTDLPIVAILGGLGVAIGVARAMRSSSSAA